MRSSTISLNNTLTSTNQSKVSTITYNNSVTIQDPEQSIDVDLEGAGLSITDISLPFKYSFWCRSWSRKTLVCWCRLFA